MNIFMHQCCGPCSIYLLEYFKQHEITPTAFFYNPNIHPVTEYYKRLDAAIQVNNTYKIKYIIENEYGLIKFTRLNAGHEKERCPLCYRLRLEKTAEKAKELGFEYFTSSLLYSKMQKHDIIKQIAEEMSAKYNVKFFYHDFREGWAQGIAISKELNIYRQNYCGCIYSEEDRFLTQLTKRHLPLLTAPCVTDLSNVVNNNVSKHA